ncbi:Zeta toxin [Arthrobacter alpinus]|uniref:UDP-N-acetylglucosamine kinase n=1 Tax=Arthrobacter alpinus TaxID=656366 RepID=A0A1H5PF75_9MICC|nr:zeta toxin family protein [Arthrobacter alpinus]SEF12386.1 Zeta toxin [Arthrobacter alpinus]
MSRNEFAVFINGSYGVGKSSALDHVADLMAAARRPFSVMDVDWFHRSWPPAAEDPANVLTEAKNMSAVWQNYRATGTRNLVVSGVIASIRDQARYAEAFDLRIRSVRLVASEEVTRMRLAARYSNDQGLSLDWHLERFQELSESIAQAGLDELVIDTSLLSPAAVAESICEHFDLVGQVS